MGQLPAMFAAVMKVRAETKVVEPPKKNSTQVMSKQEIIENKPKKKVVREYFRSLVESMCAE